MNSFIRESLLHYVWQYKKYDFFELKTSNNQTIEIIKGGIHNFDAGPDFLQATIKIDNKVWYGNVEMHTKSSDWLKHKHQLDPNYNSVILHVVFEEDVPIFYADSKAIPCLVLGKRISHSTIKNYVQLMENKMWVPCQNMFSSISNDSIEFWKYRLVVERMEDRVLKYKSKLNLNNIDWDQNLYVAFLSYLSAKVNRLGFEELGKALPYKLLQKHRNNIFQIEALLFGTANVLPKESANDYVFNLKKEYDFLSKKYNIKPISPLLWKFARLRPQNFVTVRLAQFAKLINQRENLFSQLFYSSSIVEIKKLLSVQINEGYWLSHFHFGKKSKVVPKSMGTQLVESLVINAIVPFRFLHGMWHDDEAEKENALSILDQLPSEKNKIIKNWVSLGMKCDTAMDSQALIELKSNYCDVQRCLDCQIGHAILSNE